jgi:malate/lactate dehydrogenase
MPRVAIVGAGDTGAAVARALAEREAVREIRLIDPNANAAAGRALDILQSGPIAGSDTMISSAAEAAAALDADVIVIADRHGDGQAWPPEQLVEIVRRVARGSDAPLVFACPDHRSILARAAGEIGVASRRLVGSAPEALSSCARALVAAASGASPAEIDVPVTGAPGAWVLAWSQAHVAGSNVAAALPPHAILRLDGQVKASWPPGPQALGSAAARVVAVMTSGAARGVTVFTTVERSADVRRVVAAVPAHLDRRGIERVQWPALSERERVELDTVLAGLE